jgi:hypothetical protein
MKLQGIFVWKNHEQRSFKKLENSTPIEYIGLYVNVPKVEETAFMAI